MYKRQGLGYAALIWTHEIKTARIQTELKKLDRLAMLSFAQVKRSTPTEGLRIIYDIIPAHLFLEKVGLASYVRQYDYLSSLWRGSTNKKTFNVSHLKRWDLLQEEAKLETENVDKYKCKVWDRKPFFIGQPNAQLFGYRDEKSSLTDHQVMVENGD